MAKSKRSKRAKQNRRRASKRQPSAAQLDDVALIQSMLLESGTPPEVVAALDHVSTPDEAVEALMGAGILPSTPEEATEGLLGMWQPLLATNVEPVEAEISAYEFFAMVRRMADPEDVPEILSAMPAEAEAHGSREALAMLRALAATGPSDVREPATAAAARLAAAGVKEPKWASVIGRPEPGPCFGYADFFGHQQTIVLSFSYGRKRHGIAVLIDHGLGGGVKDCWVSAAPGTLRAEFRRAAAAWGIELEDYSPAEAVSIIEKALSSEPCPEQPDQIEDVDTLLDLLRQRTDILRNATTAAPAAPTVHRLKISLRGAKPPIWRRLEVPSTVTLERLHQIIQVAFHWFGGHLWVFETLAGEYGLSDAELGHRSAKSKPLADVAAGQGDKLRYVYDFGDDWLHDILVEDVLDAEPGVAYPRCLTGRRAAPPEDCGGIWGYESMLEILADPDHPDHDGTLEWLDLASPDDLDPAAFDRDDVNRLLRSRLLVR